MVTRLGPQGAQKVIELEDSDCEDGQGPEEVEYTPTEEDVRSLCLRLLSPSRPSSCLVAL